MYKSRFQQLGEFITEELLKNSRAKIIQSNCNKALKVVEQLQKAIEITIEKRIDPMIKEAGVVVMGLKHDGVIHLIEDASGNYSPNEFCQRVSELYRIYKAEMVVIETNNGGDFLKATLLLHDPILNVFEVRASSTRTPTRSPL